MKFLKMGNRGLVFWSRSVCFHTCKVFEFVGKQIPVTIAYCQREFRNIENIDIKNVTLVHINNEKDVNRLINETIDCIHINNAIKIEPEYKLLKYAFKQLVHNKLFIISLFQEQFGHWGFLGLLRKIKWWYVYKFGMGKYIKYIGCTGRSGLLSMKKIGIKDKKLFDFIYTPQHMNFSSKITSAYNCVNFLMVGQLVPRKSVEEVVDIFNNIDIKAHLTIVGDGVLEETIRRKANNNCNISILGRLGLNDVQCEYEKADFLILPSKFDGWGCSVNEALLQGCKVIVSDRSGSHSLVEINPSLGYVFKYNDFSNLKDILIKCVYEGKLNNRTRCQIRNWAKCITPEVEGKYLLKVLDYIETQNNKPVAPWETTVVAQS